MTLLAIHNRLRLACIAKRGFIGLALAMVLLACATPVSAQDTPESRPNIIVFLVDDMGWTDTSVVFSSEETELNRRYRTPHMERLAEQGVMFTQAYASAVCSPSRVSLMTGMNAARHGVTNWTLHRGQSPDSNDARVQPPDWPLNGLAAEEGTEQTITATSLPQILGDAGYRTIHAGKAHFGAVDTPGADPLNLGFDVNIAGHAAGGPGSYLGTNNFSAAFRNGSRVWDVPGLDAYHGQDIYLSEAITLESIKAMESAVEDEQPFFLYLAHYAIHAPFEADDRFLPNYTEQGIAGRPAVYASMVESMDKSLGDVLDWLSEQELEDNTLVIFMSDNGASLAVPLNHPLRGGKLRPYEGGTRVPMIVRWPGYTAVGERQTTSVIIEDVFTTVLQAAGVDDPEIQQPVDSVSFIPLLNAESADEQDRALVWHYPHTYYNPPYSSIRIGDWKLIWHYKDQRAELFNLAEDIGEAHNLAASNPEKLLELSSQLSQLLAERGALMPIDKATGEAFPRP